MPIRYRRSHKKEKVVGVASAIAIGAALWWMWASNQPSVAPEMCEDVSNMHYYQPDIRAGDSEGFGDEYRDLLDKLSDPVGEVELFDLPEAELAMLPIYELPGYTPNYSVPPSGSRVIGNPVLPPPTFWLLQPGVNPVVPGVDKPPCGNNVDAPGTLFLMLGGLYVIYRQFKSRFIDELLEDGK